MPGFPLIRTVAHCFRTISSVVVDLVRLALLAGHSRRALTAENLFLRKQLALFQGRIVKPRRANDSTRWVMATMSRMFPWRGALVNVQADTLIRWHRKGFRLFWRWKSKPSVHGFLSVIKRPNLHDASASAEKPGQLRSPGRHCIFRPRLARFHSNNSQIVQEISALVHSLRPTFVMQFRSFYN
jgi:hypothetical protein